MHLCQKQVQGLYKDAQILNILFKFGKSFNKYGKFVEEFWHYDTLSWAHRKKLENLVYIWKILFNLENLSINMENFFKKLDTIRLWVEHMAKNFENPFKQAWE